MIRPLRRYHFIVWQIAAAALPTLFALAILFRPASPPQGNAPDDFSFAVNKAADSLWRVSITLNNPLQTPSCLVYGEAGGQKILLGQLNTEGEYSFTVVKQLDRVILFDAIHQKEITTFPITN